MPAYEFVALNAKGRQEKGLIEGDSPRTVRGLLRDRGLSPLEVHEVSDRRNSNRPPSIFDRSGVSSTELALFTRQLATLSRSGLPLDEALAAVAQQSESRRVQRITLGVRSAVTEGSSLANALAQFPGVFPPMFRATIEAGEQSGKLDGVLERLAEYVERRQALQSKMMLALIYPSLLTLAAVAAVAFLLAVVVPKVVGVFSDLDAKLPALTLGLIAVSNFLVEYGAALLVALVVGSFLFSRALRGEGFRRGFDRWLLSLPLVGRLTRGATTGRFTRTLGILFGSGVPILDALRIGTQVVTNLPMRDAIEAATLRVREGAALSKALGESKLFPPITLHLIASGESSGRLDDMLNRAAENQEREVETLVAALMGLFEPLLLVTMGLVVALIMLAILLPIFDLNTLVK